MTKTCPTCGSTFKTTNERLIHCRPSCSRTRTPEPMPSLFDIAEIAS